jgi:uncharacterized protein YhbP (UPF0306 family)
VSRRSGSSVEGDGNTETMGEATKVPCHRQSGSFVEPGRNVRIAANLLEGTPLNTPIALVYWLEGRAGCGVLADRDQEKTDMNRFRFKDIHLENVTGGRLDNDPPGQELMQASVCRILEANLLCSIATVTAEGRPHINTAYFSYSDALEIYFLSHPGSLHCRNLLTNPAMAMAVFSSAQRWTEPGQGVQLFGTCEHTSGIFADEAERSYANRFHDYTSWKRVLQDSDLARQYRFYLFRVSRMKILDERAFGDAIFVWASVH